MATTEKHALQLLLENTDYADRLRSYSGRGMYGKSCLGVTVSSMGDLIADLLGAAVDSTQDEPDGEMSVADAAEAVRGMRTDNMGHDTIAYFPGVPYVDDEESEEDLDDQGDDAPPGSDHRLD